MKDTTTIGKICELKLATRFLQEGYIVSAPIKDARYDLLVDNGKRIYRIQCKSGKLGKNGFVFRNSSVNIENGKYVQRHYDKDVDYFGVYVPELNKEYLVPVGTGHSYLRFTPYRNTKLASDYENFTLL